MTVMDRPKVAPSEKLFAAAIPASASTLPGLEGVKAA